jgi:hypothetical protein
VIFIYSEKQDNYKNKRQNNFEKMNGKTNEIRNETDQSVLIFYSKKAFKKCETINM